MRELDLPPGPRIGWFLAALLEEVLDDPKLNEREGLILAIKKLNKLTDAKLRTSCGELKEQKR